MNIVLSSLVVTGILVTILSVLSNFNWNVSGFVDVTLGALANCIWVFIGFWLSLMVSSLRKPRLDIVVDPQLDSDVHYADGQRWKFFRVKVINRPLPAYARLLGPRMNAVAAHATIFFRQQGQVMKGRWSNTIELVSPSVAEYIHQANTPDPVHIPVGGSESLDVIAKYYTDSEAYGWNNEAYLHNWRTPHYRLLTGDWEVDILVTAQDGSHVLKAFTLHVAPTIDATYIMPLNAK